jgi:hypothetical protein
MLTGQAPTYNLLMKNPLSILSFPDNDLNCHKFADHPNVYNTC